VPLFKLETDAVEGEKTDRLSKFLICQVEIAIKKISDKIYTSVTGSVKLMW